jgi:hypothetical protein
VLRIESDDDGDSGTQLGLGFRVGAMRLDASPDGKR